MKKGQRYKILIHVFFVLMCLCYIFPLVMVISISLSSEESVIAGGFRLWPQEFTSYAYKVAFADTSRMIRAYIVTAAQAIIGTIGSLIVAGMVAYPLSRSNFAYKGPITFIVFFTMLFGGGLIPSYIINTQYYHLGNNFLIYILPGLTGGAYNTLMIRTFFQGLPESLFESAKIDGASEMKIFWKIAVPLSKPVFATVGFMTLVGKWNDWNTSLVYIRDSELHTLQYLLQRILNEASFLKSVSSGAFGSIDIDFTALMREQPVETLRYAMCVICAGPMLVVFPFFQKYFVKGTTIGAIKG